MAKTVHDPYLEEQIATQKITSAVIWLRRPALASAGARKAQIDDLIDRAADVSGLRPIEVALEEGKWDVQGHTGFWIEAPSAFLAILTRQPEIHETHFCGRRFALDPSVLAQWNSNRLEIDL